MLKEKIHYNDRLPLNVNIINIEEYPIHFHDDLEILFILEGSIILKNGYYNYKMNVGDIFILNDQEIHSFKKSSVYNMVLMLQMDKDYFINHYPNLNNSFFVADVDDPEDRDLGTLRELLVSAIIQANSEKAGYEQKLIEIAHNILSCLMENFQYFAIEDGRFVNETKNKSNKIMAARMDRVSHYLYENYSRKITLQEIADREHLSIYHLSHVIKQSSGLSFKELLGFIRVEESEKLLLGSDMSINAVSETVGFSATRYYIEHFKKWFDYDPVTYRKIYEGKVSSRKTPVVMKKVSQNNIDETIKKYYPDVYYDHHRKEQIPCQVLDINIETEDLKEVKETALYGKMASSDMCPASQLLDMMISLEEYAVDSGDNYIVTGDKGGNHISILVCNPDSLSTNTDVLVRVKMLNGKYSLKRVIFSAEKIDSQIKKKKSIMPCSDRRKELFRQLASTPVVENSTVTAVNTLNLMLSLSGRSGELLLLDKICE